MNPGSTYLASNCTLEKVSESYSHAIIISFINLAFDEFPIKTDFELASTRDDSLFKANFMFNKGNFRLEKGKYCHISRERFLGQLSVFIRARLNGTL
jgi:hypothetical protein